MQNLKKPIAVVIILAGTVLAGAGVLRARAVSGSLSVSPDSIATLPGMTVDLAFNLSAAADTQGVDIQFGFDPAVLQMVDADGAAGGVQVALGTCPAPDVVVINDVNNPGGTGQYAAASLSGTCSDGPVFTATFTCIAEGTSSIVINNAEISDPDGNLNPVSLFSGTVNCFPYAIYLPVIQHMP